MARQREKMQINPKAKDILLCHYKVVGYRKNCPATDNAEKDTAIPIISTHSKQIWHFIWILIK